ncbi:hypothetical protein ACFJIV_28925 [Mucilaginibacter sp. UC70_90]
MKIIDMNGKPITITDLEKAIEMAVAYKDYHHADGSYQEMDKRLEAYWTDVYNKLLQLKAEEENKDL